MRHYDKKGNWGTRKRIWRHPLIGKTLFHMPLGYGRITKMWQEISYVHNAEPHCFTTSVIEFTTDTGLRYVMHYVDFACDAEDSSGKLLAESKIWDGFDGHLRGFGWKRFFAQMND